VRSNDDVNLRDGAPRRARDAIKFVALQEKSGFDYVELSVLLGHPDLKSFLPDWQLSRSTADISV
jgi:hypothetical protein